VEVVVYHGDRRLHLQTTRTHHNQQLLQTTKYSAL
jgi:hypothetical protein